MIENGEGFIERNNFVDFYKKIFEGDKDPEELEKTANEIFDSPIAINHEYHENSIKSFRHGGNVVWFECCHNPNDTGVL